MFFSFDGIDGVGKTTQMKLFVEWLQERGHDVISCRDPGSTALGEALREVVLHSPETTRIGLRSEMLIYMAARAQLVDEVIAPALSEGKVVVSDRFLLANIVYQGYAGGLEVEAVRQVGQIATQGIRPDAVFLLDMPSHEAHGRLGVLDRMETRGNEYRERLREGFLEEATYQGSNVHVIRADREIELVQREVQCIASRLLAA